MLTPTEGFNLAIDVAIENFEKARGRIIIAEGIANVLNTQYRDELPFLLETISGDASKAGELIALVEEVTYKSQFAVLTAQSTAADIIRHTVKVSREINESLYRATQLEGIQSIEMSGNILALASALDSLPLDDEVARTHKEFVSIYVEGLDAIGNAGEKEMAALDTLDRAYSDSLTRLIHGEVDNSVYVFETDLTKIKGEFNL